MSLTSQSNVNMHKNFLWLIVSGLVLVADFLSKKWAFTQLALYQPLEITPFFNATLAFNKGAAFSFLNSASGWQNRFFITIGFVISIILLTWLYQLTLKEKGQGLAICLILGGAWGNIYDRFTYGYVIDFLDFHIGLYHWPIFNIADSAICIGASIMLFLTVKETKKID